MNASNDGMNPQSAEEYQPLIDSFCEVLKLTDEMVTRVTDAEVDERLCNLLTSAGHVESQTVHRAAAKPGRTQKSALGVLWVHSAPPALCPHVEWAVAGILGKAVTLAWVSQDAAPGMVRAELHWQATPGTAGAIASALAGWNRLRFEVTEDASPGCDGVRYCYTPNLGIFSAVTSGNGDVLIPENRLRAVMALAAMGTVSLEAELTRLLGQEWEAELEPFRYASEGAPVRWLDATG